MYLDGTADLININQIAILVINYSTINRAFVLSENFKFLGIYINSSMKAFVLEQKETKSCFFFALKCE